MKKILLGAGCFWGVEEAFKNTSGVLNTRVGYSGGDFDNPTYKDVCSGKTGHAEVVSIEYETSKISLSQLLEIFWKIHNPTTLNKQGPDVGTQYRSVIFCFEKQQLEEAMESLKNHQKELKNPIVTQIEMAKPFYEAEEYHQCYFEKQK